MPRRGRNSGPPRMRKFRRPPVLRPSRQEESAYPAGASGRTDVFHKKFHFSLDNTKKMGIINNVIRMIQQFSEMVCVTGRTAEGYFSIMAMTMTELAKRLNLSQSTVSLVLNNRDKGRVRPELAERIRQEAAATGFRLNRAASDLRRRRSNTIGVALPSPQNGYHATLIFELHQEIIQRGYCPVFAFFETEEEQKNSTQLLLNSNVEAIITGEPRWLPDTLELPVVSFYSPDCRFDSVELGNEAALHLALKYLHRLGHRSVGWLGSDSEWRAQHLPEIAAVYGMSVRLSAEKLPAKTLVCADGMALVDQYRKRNGSLPSAFLAHNDMVAMGAIRQLHELGFRVPNEVSMIGQDDLADTRYTIPALTTIAYETPAYIAQTLLDHIFRRMNDPEGEPRRTIIPPRLVIRESCAAASPVSAM